MTEVEFNCPECKANLVVDERHFGSEIICPRCSQEIRVPFLRRMDGSAMGGAAASTESGSSLPGQGKNMQDAHEKFLQRRRLRRKEERRKRLLHARKAILVGAQTDEEEPAVLFPCITCEQSLISEHALIGLDVYCPTCGHAVEVPDPKDENFGVDRRGREIQSVEILQQHHAKAVTIEDVADGSPIPEPGMLAGTGLLPAVVSEDGRLLLGMAHLQEMAQNLQGLPGPGQLGGGSNPRGGGLGGPYSGPASSSPAHKAARVPGALKTPIRNIRELVDAELEDYDDFPVARGLPATPKGQRTSLGMLIGIGALVALLAASVFFGLRTLDRMASKKDGIDAPSPTVATDLNEDEMTEPRIPEDISDLETQQINLSPEEKDAALATVRRYLIASNWKERLQFVRMPNQTEPLMAEYYRGKAEGPITYEEISLMWSGVIRGTFLVLITVIDTDFRELFFTLERVGENQFLIDWQVLVQYNPMTWEELKEVQPKEPLNFRVNLTQGEYYNFQFSDEEFYQCYEIRTREEFTGLYGYVRRDADFFDSLDVRDGFSKLAIVKLRYPDEVQSNRVVEIVDFVQPGWIVFSADLVEEVAEQAARLEASAAGEGEE